MENRQTGSKSSAKIVGCRSLFPRGWGSFLLFFLLMVSVVFPGRAAQWETLGGWETDSYAQGYGFLGEGYLYPLSSHWTFLSRLTESYLYYHYTDSAGYHDIKSPGLNAMIGIRPYNDTVSLTLLAGLERRWTAKESTTGDGSLTDQEIQDGGIFQADLNYNIGHQSRIDLLVNYSGADRYTFSRLLLAKEILKKENQFSLTAGVEGIAQGNQDIVSGQEGIHLETYINAIKASFSIRSGYKKSWFPEAPIQEGIYFGVGFYRGFY